MPFLLRIPCNHKFHPEADLEALQLVGVFFVTIDNGWKPLEIVTTSSILDVAGKLDVISHPYKYFLCQIYGHIKFCS